MKLEVNGVELDIKRTLRTDMIYEDLYGKAIDINKINQHTILGIFTASIIAAQQRQGVKEMTKEEVMKWLEDDPIREMYVGIISHEWVNDFINYLKLVQTYYDNEAKKTKKKKNNNITIDSTDDEKKS